MSLSVAAYGWEHADWLTDYFPDDLPADWRLDFYANDFRAVVLPRARWYQNSALDGFADDVDDGFGFWLEVDGKEKPALLDAAVAALGARLAGFVATGGKPVANGDARYPILHASKPGLCWLQTPPEDSKALRAVIESFMDSVAPDDVGLLVFAGSAARPRLMQEARVIAELLGY